MSSSEQVEVENLVQNLEEEDLNDFQVLCVWASFFTIAALLYAFFAYNISHKSAPIVDKRASRQAHRGALPQDQQAARQDPVPKAPKPIPVQQTHTPGPAFKSKTESSAQGQQAARQAAIARYEAQHEAAVAEAKAREAEKLEKARQAAREKQEKEQEAARQEQQRLAKEREKSAGLMAELQRRKTEGAAQREAEAQANAQRRQEALAETREGLKKTLADELGSVKVYAKKADGSNDARVLLSSIDRSSLVNEIKEAVFKELKVPCNEQVLVVNGQVLKNDTSALVESVQRTVSEICIIVLRQA